VTVAAAGIIIYVTVAVVDLIAYASFQAALQRAGFIILPNPLRLASAAVTPQPQRQLPGPAFLRRSGSRCFRRGLMTRRRDVVSRTS
jgi:hypothetical protein